MDVGSDGKRAVKRQEGTISGLFSQIEHQNKKQDRYKESEGVQASVKTKTKSN